MTEGCPDNENKAVVVELKGVALAAVVGTVKADVRRNFSTPHILAADHFARELEKHEAVHSGKGWGQHFDLCTWNASASIILAFSAIEAAIDEAEDDLAVPNELTRVFDRSPTLDRAQALLAHMNCAPFNRGTDPFQSADLLRALRNGLVHPKAEWDSARERNSKLSIKIVSANLPLSQFQTDPALAFPHGCMSAGVAQWAAASARRFVRELRSRLGLKVDI